MWVTGEEELFIDSVVANFATAILIDNYHHKKNYFIIFFSRQSKTTSQKIKK